MSDEKTGPATDADSAAEELTETTAGDVGDTEGAEGAEISVEPDLQGATTDIKRRRPWLAMGLAALLVAAVAAAGSVYWWIYRPDRLTNAASQQRVTDAAREGTVALLSYAPETLDKDLATAKSHLTGEFLKYYSDFTDKIVAPAAKQKGVKTEATVARAAVSEMQPDHAVVLVFVNQVTTSKDRPDPALATSSVLVTMVNQDGRWLISEFNPV
ncbi:MAG TPA: twin-arginine translocation pathway signal [Mycobacterium sp.]|nr:twin-arginine translocation pathway signal [Mycobacterium sp.]HNF04552.1 twin-arginine translocation pathway signal [Mycobacterium sp.]HNM93559.1 twin-arginine translocation pathway signal [Mycobacterium sp.]